MYAFGAMYIYMCVLRENIINNVDIIMAFLNNATPEYYILYSAKTFQMNRLN